MVVASENEKVANEIRDIFMNENLRVYTSLDVKGVELGGALKNIIAFSCNHISILFAFSCNIRHSKLAFSCNISIFKLAFSCTSHYNIKMQENI